MLFPAVLFAVAALQAPSARVFPLAPSESPQAAEELAITLRTVGRFQPSAVVVSQNSLSVSGTADQLALARWLIGELDQSTGAAPHQYRPQDGTGDVVQILYLAHFESQRDLMEVLTTIRTITELRYVYPYYKRKAMAVRGALAQIELMEWMAAELDQPANAPRTTRNFNVPDGTGDVVRVSHLVHSDTPQKLQEVMTLIRTMTDIRRVFPVQSRKALSWRGTADQIRLVEWMVGELDQPADAPLPANTAEHQTGVNDGSGEVVRLFHLTQARTPRDLDETMTLIRVLTEMRRAFPSQTRKALGFRGTPEQMRLGEWLVNTLALPPGSGPQMTVAGGDQVGVFFLPPARTTQELHALFGAVRTATQAPRMFFTEAQKAIAIRGTADQVATARRMIE